LDTSPQTFLQISNFFARDISSLKVKKLDKSPPFEYFNNNKLHLPGFLETEVSSTTIILFGAIPSLSASKKISNLSAEN
jgi:hypothetical protein